MKELGSCHGGDGKPFEVLDRMVACVDLLLSRSGFGNSGIPRGTWQFQGSLMEMSKQFSN